MRAELLSGSSWGEGEPWPGRSEYFRQTPKDLQEEIINTRILGRIKEKGDQQGLQWHICSINLIKSSPFRVALPAWILSSRTPACASLHTTPITACLAASCNPHHRHRGNGAPQTKRARFSSTNFTLDSLWKLCSYLTKIKPECWLNNLWQLFAFRVYDDAYSHHKMSKGHKDNGTGIDTSHYQNNEIK